MRRQRILRRSGRQSTGHETFMIGVPWQIAEAIPEGMEFEVRLTEDGILFRPSLGVNGPLPSWLVAQGRDPA